VLNNYKNLLTFNELKNVFPGVNKYYREGREDIGFILGMIALDAKSYQVVNLFGITLIFEALDDKNRMRRIFDLYNFSYTDFIELTAKHDIFSVEPVRNLGNQLAESNAQLAESNTQVQTLANELQEIKKSKVWRVALFLRRLRVLIFPSSSLQFRLVNKASGYILMAKAFLGKKLFNSGKGLKRVVRSTFELTNILAIETPDQLIKKVEEHLVNEDFIISISHDNYVESTGGVQIKISDEQATYNNNGISYLHIYPYRPSPFLAFEDKPFYLGINCDGKNIGISEGEGFLLVLKKIKTKRLKNIFIHHTMGFDIGLIGQILELGNKKGRFWLHDNFSICPSYYLLRNDLEYCGAPDAESITCNTCLYGEMRHKQYPFFKKIFDENNMEVVSPSNYTLNFWKENSGYIVATEKVIPHANLIWHTPLPLEHNTGPIRIAFIGFPVFHKGWETWQKLINEFSNESMYKFFLFSSMAGTKGNYERVSVTTSRDKRFSMVEAIKKHNIDVAFLWSLCPETFSFTLQESLAAGCYILTNKNSGNIQDYLRQNPNRGIVLNDEKDLYNLFSSGDIFSHVKAYQNNGKLQGEIVLFSELE